ncbi:AraC family transcriptional regulator [Micromonospora sp. NPDC047707]|uniref:helix-turn-helix transcriptional regulator n=1 Tax=Micromonospora sp. NPDC047707 TaxID=3154498 RepID=UPI0034526845
MSTQEPVIHRFDSRDPELAHDYLAASYGTRLRIEAGGPYRLRHHRVDLGAVRLDDTAHSGDLRIDVEPLGTLVVCETVSARVSRSCAGAEHRFTPGDTFLAAPPERAHSVRWQVGAVAVCVLDLGLLARAAGTATPLRFDVLTAAPPHLARHWRTTVAYLREAVLANPEAAGQPLVRGAAIRMVAAAATTAFGGAVPGDVTAEDGRDAGAATVRRAIAFMEEHAHEDIGATDIAAAARVSPRAVQLAFRTHLDITPMAHLRGIRLYRAHQDLLRADPERETVARIAHRWGFVSHSRFTARYQATFGVPPSRTLHT